ncbi:MAG TPA: imidazoleglycerol-phosphate dehydratase HisB [bacterium]|nr:imidazoleglycerol-phosphate dehydratase HisB [bacterium]
MKRTASMKRHTKETQIDLSVNLDGTGKATVSTGIEFFDHMLELFAKHAKVDLTLRARGDLKVDYHHTVEDTGIALGTVLKEALGSKAGIRRYGFCLLPMDEALAQVALDLSGRPYLKYDVEYGRKKIVDFDPQLVEEFFYALAVNGGITLHISSLAGKNVHHIFEAVFKGFAKSFEMAVAIDAREKGIPSTKGVL